MVHKLLTLLKRVKINLTAWLNPFKIEVRGKLLFLGHYSVFLRIREVLFNEFAIISFTNHYISDVLFFVLLNINIIEGWISKDWKFITKPLVCSLIQPFMLWTVTLEFTFKPWIYWSIMKYNIMIKCWLKLIRVEYLDSSSLPSWTNWFSFTHINFYMDHTVREGF